MRILRILENDNVEDDECLDTCPGVGVVQAPQAQTSVSVRARTNLLFLSDSDDVGAFLPHTCRFY